MIEINGWKGGGQILRTALTFSAIKQEPFRIENIRGSRTTPGIQKQHLEAVKAVKKLTDAETKGMELGSEELVFKPQGLENQSFTVNIGTAGSVNLVLDTVLPITSQFDKSFRIDLKGGTDVKWAPPTNTYKHVKMPMLEKLGVKADYTLESTGFYPSGKGRIRVETEPHSLKPANFTERGELERFEIYSKASKNLENQNVAKRKADEAERILKNSYMSREVEKNIEYVDASSTGSIITLKAVYEDTVAGFDKLGEKGVRAEEIAHQVVKQFKSFHSTEAGLDSKMADQLMVYMALTGGTMTTPQITSHVQTNTEVITQFSENVLLERDKVARIEFQ